MPVQIVIGRAGSGKTLRCFEAVTAALRADPLGPPVYWIVPRQATFMTERALVTAPGIGAFCRARVLSFDSLGEEVLQECGGAAVPEVTALGRQMIIGHLLRKNADRLRVFGQAARQSGLATRLDATFDELEKNGRDLADLAALMDGLSQIVSKSGEQQALFDKIHDIRLIYEQYTAYLGQERLDRHRRLTQVLSCMQQSRRFKGAQVYVDGFAAFTEYERQVLAQLARVCERLEIMLLMDPSSPLLSDPHLLPDELGWFCSMEETYRRLHFTFKEQNVPIEETAVLKPVQRFAAPALAELEAQLQWRLSISRLPPDGIELLEAPDRRAEVDAVARRIRALWREGVRLREMAVLVRDLDPYHEIIAASFREHGIAYFVDRRRSMGHHPLLQFLRAALAVALHRWPHDAVMTLVKSGLSGLADEEADELENYVLEHRVRGSAWTASEPWTFSRKSLAREDEEAPPMVAARVDPLRRRLAAPLASFAKKASAKGQSIRSLVLAILELLNRFNVQQALQDWMKRAHEAGDYEQRDQHEQVWTGLVDLLDQMVALIGDEPATLADFVDILESGLEGFELALTPPTTDQLLVGQVDRTRTPDVKVALVLGMNEGVFPRLPVEDSVLSDAERRELRQRKLEIQADTQRKLLDENLLAYIALTRASHRLIVARSLTDGAGKSSGPSPYWRRLQSLFPSLSPVSVQVHPIGTPRQLIVSLMHWVRSLDKELTGEVEPALYHWLASHPPADDAIDVMRFRAWKALSYTNEPGLSRETARLLFTSPLTASVTRIESFAACPFRHFAQYGLALRPRDDEESVSALDLGNVFHHVLEKIVATMIEQKQKWQDVPAEKRKALIHATAQEVGRQLRDEIMLSSARNRYLLERIERTLEDVTAAQEAAARRGQFAPAFAELTFGEDGEVPGLEIITPSKKKVVLCGKIDRVDVVADQAAVAVIDYKLRGNTLALDRVYHGLSLQLLTYLLVLRENGHKSATLSKKPLTPAAAFYVTLLRQLEDVKHPDEAKVDDPAKLDLRVKPRGIFESSHFKSLDGECSGGRSDVVAAQINKDGTFGNRRGTDVAEAAEFAALIDHVHKRIAELCDQILSGRIDIRPYLINNLSPCPACDYRPVCRFDPSINRYQVLEKLSREQVLSKLTQGGDQ